MTELQQVSACYGAALHLIGADSGVMAGALQHHQDRVGGTGLARQQRLLGLGLDLLALGDEVGPGDVGEVRHGEAGASLFDDKGQPTISGNEALLKATPAAAPTWPTVHRRRDVAALPRSRPDQHPRQ